jgi:hypothetical protein
MGGMSMNKDLAAPCGLYCGVCSIYIATKKSNATIAPIVAMLFSEALNVAVNAKSQLM